MTFEEILKSTPARFPLDINGKLIPIDLSADNNEIARLGDSASFETYIEGYIRSHNGDAAFGGYHEIRTIYRRSDLFNGGNERNVHIGLDIWASAGTSVIAPATGKVRSFAYNAGLGNYGPTIILEHKTANAAFYTLYGHLSVDSISELEIGDKFSAGDKIGELGSRKENGDYPAHLHFQIIKDLEGFEGDYPGVCNSSDLNHYLDNCPDPNLLLKIQQP